MKRRKKCKKWYLFSITIFVLGINIICSACGKEQNQNSIKSLDNNKEKESRENGVFYELQTPSPETISIQEGVRINKLRKEKERELKGKKKKESKHSNIQNKVQQEKKQIDESYFNDAVFIGDSRTEGFGLQSGLKNITVYTEKGLMVDTIFTNQPVVIDGQRMSIIEALQKQSFGKVYIMFGINELGWVYDEIFIKKYEKVIDAIKESQPDAVIYIQSIIHVSGEKEKNSDMSNEKINRRNKLIEKMAKERKVEYIDLNKVLTDKNGNLYKEASVDGVHLNRTYCQIWKNYLLENTKK